MYGLDFRIKTMASLVRKVLEKSNGDAAAVGGVLKKQNDALRYTVLFPTESYVRGVNEVRRPERACPAFRTPAQGFVCHTSASSNASARGRTSPADPPRSSARCCGRARASR
jgi:hypothetical protein